MDHGKTSTMGVVRTVLVVDDDADIRESLRELLTEEGFEVEVVCHGQEALKWLDAHPRQSCIILLDMMMPVMDGEMFLRARNRRAELSVIPVIVITAGGSRQGISTAFNVQACLLKPIDIRALLDALGSCPTSS